MNQQPPAPTRTLLAFLARLVDRYDALASAGRPGREPRPAEPLVPPDLAQERLDQLRLAEAALRHALTADLPRPPQIAVVGPTQTGKSTVVNLLLGREAAGVSPLAGFTIHAEGFWIAPPTPNDESWTAELFPGWPRRARGELARGSPAAFSLTRLDAAPAPAEAADGARGAALRDAVVWDTPDFDSLAARTYRRGVLETIGAADVIVLVVSPEKYADLTVWRLLRLVGPLRRPLVACLNKATRDASGVLAASLRRRLAELSGTGGEPCSEAADAPVVALPYVADVADLAGNVGCDARRRLLDAVRDALARRPDRGARLAGARALVREHWPRWTEPIEAEHAARRAWCALVDDALEDLVRSYRRDYLDHPQRFDSLRRATIELLRLLELPVVAGAMQRVRRVVTWPARQVAAAGRAWWQRGRAAAGDAGIRSPAAEEFVLNEGLDRLLVRLERDAAREARAAGPGPAVWHDVTDQLGRRADGLRERFVVAADDCRRRFDASIRAAAGRLYEALRQQPALLAALRAGRAAVDVGSVALAVKTAGLGAADLVLAPATLALTSMLAEGALGAYMGRVADELRAAQLEHVRIRLVDGVLRPALRSMSDAPTDAPRFAVREEELAAAARSLEAEWGGPQ